MVGEVTDLLARWTSGDSSALDVLMPIVYGELRRTAASAMRRQHDSVLQPTALVHEAWMRLGLGNGRSFANRTQFLALAGKIMRDILVDAARRRNAGKRGGSWVQVPMEEAHGQSACQLELVQINHALHRLGMLKSRYLELVEMRWFGGLTIAECSDLLDVSHATVEREWRFVRTWLRRELQRPAVT